MIRRTSILVFTCFLPVIAYAQSVQLPDKETEKAGDNGAVPLLLRIPASLIAKSVNRDFEHDGTVNQIILGTTSSGASHCTGQVTCVVEDNPAGVSILCTIAGVVKSKTHGTNGPAIIRSESSTQYTAAKRLTFDGFTFACKPATASSCTRVMTTGIGSSLPRLRGRLVIRVASKRVEESRAQAEAIVNSQTEMELCQKIDEEFDGRIRNLNEQFANKLTILKYFPGAQKQLQLSSSQDGVELALGHTTKFREENDGRRDPMGEAVELWLRRSENLDAGTSVSKILFSKAPVWLSTYVSENPLFQQVDDKKWEFDVREKWIVVKLHQ